LRKLLCHAHNLFHLDIQLNLLFGTPLFTHIYTHAGLKEQKLHTTPENPDLLSSKEGFYQ
jgi:hypothetical protein